MSPAAPAPAKQAGPCLARQPILTRDEKVLGYELLFRESPEDKRFSSDAENATSSTINALNVMGLDVICDGKLAFINCTQQMLLKEYFLLLPADQVVVEIQESVASDDRVVDSCQRLKQQGYRIALDNLVPGDPRASLIAYADYAKVDIRKVAHVQELIASTLAGGKRCQMLAEKVETRVQFLTAAKDGFTLFQGYFFRHPERMRARQIPANKMSSLRLLQAISAPEVDLAAVEDLIKHDASLCYRLLRYLNSPLLGIASPVQSVRHAMNLLGERELARWIRMAVTLAMGEGRCSDLVLSSLVRARFCELVAAKVQNCRSDVFLMGMLSLMDAILEMPMGIVVEGLALDTDIKAELLGAKTGNKTTAPPIYALMMARESGDWETVTALARNLALSLPFVNRSYNEAISWAHQMNSAAAE